MSNWIIWGRNSVSAWDLERSAWACDYRAKCVRITQNACLLVGLQLSKRTCYIQNYQIKL